jgi:hypothetical protein
MDKKLEQLVQESFYTSYRSINVGNIVRSSVQEGRLVDPEALVSMIINETGAANSRAMIKILDALNVN